MPQLAGGDPSKIARQVAAPEVNWGEFAGQQ
jgi:hypothetical protein